MRASEGGINAGFRLTTSAAEFMQIDRIITWLIQVPAKRKLKGHSLMRFAPQLFASRQSTLYDNLAERLDVPQEDTGKV
jgi:hypothetical protein